ncbi:Uncharacterised protein [Pseudomonas luteola]|uniref:Uncharacterized protein n=1 Tax=Pseudomonas luteola TaxID=47886 RepID=A0A2X2CPF4_PSELU|nr:hypothetical protein [Pseudomonas luteola]SPZ07516.1 Uncharacterised protein [Pseudomonas luteola]
MLDLDDAARSYMNELRILSTDAHGQEIIVGLTVGESERYIAHQKDFLNPGKHRTREDKDDYLRLHEKHELARIAVLMAENEARHDQSPRH